MGVAGVRFERDRVEGVARGLHPDGGQDHVEAAVLDRECEHERLGHRLDRERVPDVSRLVDRAVEGCERYPEQIGIGTPSSGM